MSVPRARADRPVGFDRVAAAPGRRARPSPAGNPPSGRDGRARRSVRRRPALRGRARRGACVEEVQPVAADDQLVAVVRGRATRRARRSGRVRSGCGRRAHALGPPVGRRSACRRETVGSSRRMSAVEAAPDPRPLAESAASPRRGSPSRKARYWPRPRAVAHGLEPLRRPRPRAASARVGLGHVEHRGARELGARRNCGHSGIWSSDLQRDVEAASPAPERSRSGEGAGRVCLQRSSSGPASSASVQVPSAQGRSGRPSRTCADSNSTSGQRGAIHAKLPAISGVRRRQPTVAR